MIISQVKIYAKDYYSCQLTSKIPVKVQLITINGDEGFGIVESLRNNLEDIITYIRELKKSNSILEVTIISESETIYWTKVIHKLSRTSIHESILESKSMTLMPIIIQSGYQIHQILSPSPEIFKKTLNLLKKSFEKVELLKVTNSVQISPATATITAKQYDALHLAFENGYYEFPRKISLEELGKELSIKKVAMRERLRRAENKIIKEFMFGNTNAN